MPSCYPRANAGRTARSVSATAGMSLIEITVAVALLGLLSAGIFTAFQVGASSWQSTRDRLMLDRRIATANAILHGTLSGIVPIRAEVPPGRPEQGRRFAFFQGEPRSMRFVTSYSVTTGVRGGLLITEMQVVSYERGLRVLLNQSPYLGPRSAGFFVAGFFQDPLRGRQRARYIPIQPRATSLIIVDELQDCRFAFLEQPPGVERPTKWGPEWTDLLRLPEAVAIHVTPKGGETRLRPISVIAGIVSKGLDQGAPTGAGGGPPPPGTVGLQGRPPS